jgi:hypothetical protein
MTFTDYVHNHLIDLDLMSRDELSDLVNSIYDQLDKNFWLVIKEQDPKLLDLLTELEDYLSQDEVAWITRYKYYNS